MSRGSSRHPVLAGAVAAGERRTLADYQGFSLRAFCQACDRSIELDQQALNSRFGAAALLDKIRHRLRCRRCGRRTQRLLVGQQSRRSPTFTLVRVVPVRPSEEQFFPTRFPCSHIVVSGVRVCDFKHAKLEVLSAATTLLVQDLPEYYVAAMARLRVCAPPTPQPFLASCTAHIKFSGGSVCDDVDAAYIGQSRLPRCDLLLHNDV